MSGKNKPPLSKLQQEWEKRLKEEGLGLIEPLGDSLEGMRDEIERSNLERICPYCRSINPCAAGGGSICIQCGNMISREGKVETVDPENDDPRPHTPEYY